MSARKNRYVTLYQEWYSLSGQTKPSVEHLTARWKELGRYERKRALLALEQVIHGTQTLKEISDTQLARMKYDLSKV